MTAKPHFYRSAVVPGAWCCTLAIKRATPYRDRTGADRVLLPVVSCPVGRSRTRAMAYDNMLFLQRMQRSHEVQAH